MSPNLTNYSDTEHSKQKLLKISDKNFSPQSHYTSVILSVRCTLFFLQSKNKQKP